LPAGTFLKLLLIVFLIFPRTRYMHKGHCSTNGR
jgi:hypothetical protein